MFGGAFENLVGTIEANGIDECAMWAPVVWYPSGECIISDEMDSQCLQCFEFEMLAFLEDLDNTFERAAETDYIQAKGQVTEEGSHGRKLIDWQLVDACVKEFILRPKNLPTFCEIEMTSKNDIHDAFVVTMYLIVLMVVLLTPKDRMATFISGFELDNRKI